MSFYRLYILDSLGAHIEDCVEIAAQGDEEAIAAAAARRASRPRELWLQSRFVRGFKREDSASLH